MSTIEAVPAILHCDGIDDLRHQAVALGVELPKTIDRHVNIPRRDASVLIADLVLVVDRSGRTRMALGTDDEQRPTTVYFDSRGTEC